MNRRTERVSNLIRNTIGELLLAKMSDPRIDPARTSITHVEVPEDLLTARVYVSVIGTEAEQRRTLQALSHAAGHIQELMMREISLRNTPLLQFVLDTKFKKTLETFQIIGKAMEEIHRKEAAQTPSPEADEDTPQESQEPQEE
jgi:ribosome-binding factor A